MAKIHIDISQGIFDVEGEPEFVKGIFYDFKSELTSLSLKLKAAKNESIQIPYVNHSEATGSTLTQENSESQTLGLKKKPKRSVKSPPKGHSCADRMIVLRNKGFFKTHRTTNEIVTGLGKEGWTHNVSQVSASAGQMFNRGDIQRTSAGKGFTYFWDRD